MLKNQGVNLNLNKRYIDIQKKVPEKNSGLKAVVKKYLNADLCKSETCSNWEIRPLRDS